MHSLPEYVTWQVISNERKRYNKLCAKHRTDIQKFKVVPLTDSTEVRWITSISLICLPRLESLSRKSSNTCTPPVLDYYYVTFTITVTVTYKSYNTYLESSPYYVVSRFLNNKNNCPHWQQLSKIVLMCRQLNVSDRTDKIHGGFVRVGTKTWHNNINLLTFVFLTNPAKSEMTQHWAM